MPPFLCKPYLQRVANGANGARFKIVTFSIILFTNQQSRIANKPTKKYRRNTKGND